MLVTLEETKQYLRVDSADEDNYILSLITMAENMCTDIARSDISIMEEHKELVKNAVLYASAYMYEHREQADHKELTNTLKYLLFQVRREVF